jgi:hypothetical protein
VISVIHHAVHGVIPEGGNLISIAMFAIMAYMVFKFAKTKIE